MTNVTVDYKKYNAQVVLNEVNDMLAEMAATGKRKFSIRENYDRLSIFDWWKSDLTRGNLTDMRTFLKTAIELGYTGYVCFKVGATGCANGMWASVKETENGYSPKGRSLYRSFTPAYTYWSFCDDNEVWYPSTKGDEFDSLKTKKDLIEAHTKHYAEQV